MGDQLQDDKGRKPPNLAMYIISQYFRQFYKYAIIP